mgnify:CR=1 FL=1
MATVIVSLIVRVCPEKVANLFLLWVNPDQKLILKRSNPSVLSPRAMSVYHNYNESSKKYDAARFAMAGEAVNRTVKQVATQLELPADRLVGAEVGCGTGNYTVAMAEAGVGTVHALDHSAGMLDKLQKKVDESGEDSPLRKSVRVGAPIDLAAPDLALPFDDNSVHLVLIPQVTHHLVKDSESDPFAAVKRLVQEVARVIAPGGALLIQTQTPTQHRSGFWWADIIPRAAARLAKRFCEVRKS